VDKTFSSTGIISNLIGDLFGLLGAEDETIDKIKDELEDNIAIYAGLIIFVLIIFTFLFGCLVYIKKKKKKY